MAYKAIIDGDGELTIPAKLLEELGWKVGDDLAIDRDEDGPILVRRTAQTVEN